MINGIKTFYNDIGRKKAFWLPVLLFTLLGYGFSLTRNTISVDDMSLDFYGGIRGAIVASGRWGMEVWHKLLSIGGYSSYLYKFFGVLFLLAAAFILCCIFYTLNPAFSKKVYPYTFFASTLIVFPLINEIWEYNGANAILTANLFVVFLTIMYILFSKHKDWVKFIVGGLMMAIVVSSYESAVFVYITAVLCVLFYRYCILKEKKKAYSWVIDGLKFIPSIVIAVIIRFVVNFLWLRIFNVTAKPLGATSIGWFNFKFQNLVDVIKNVISNYFLRADYLPVLIWAVAAAAFVVYIIYKCVRNRSVLPLLIGALIMLSVFLLTIVQLKFFMYRTAQTVNFSVAFIVFILALAAQSFDKKWINITVVSVLALITVYQATYLNMLLEWNHVRSENEIAVVHQLGMELTRDYKKSNKEIVFCGENELSDYFVNRLYKNGKKITNTNHKMLLRWSAYASAKHKDPKINVIKKLFSYCGYDLNITGKYGRKRLAQLAKYAKKIGMQQYEIRDVGDYILVYIGE